MFSSSLPVILYAYVFGRSDNCVVTSAINKRFGLVEKSQIWLKGNTNTGSKLEVSNKIMSIVHANSSCALSVRNIRGDSKRWTRFPTSVWYVNDLHTTATALA